MYLFRRVFWRKSKEKFVCTFDEQCSILNAASSTRVTRIFCVFFLLFFQRSTESEIQYGISCRMIGMWNGDALKLHIIGRFLHAACLAVKRSAASNPII